jgi:hypothetical protein
MKVVFALAEHISDACRKLQETATHLLAEEGVEIPSPYEQACMMVRSVHRICRKPEVIQVTDATSRAVPGATVRRFPNPGVGLLQWKTSAIAVLSQEFGDGELWGILDTDTIVCQDPEPLLRDIPFEVAMYKRRWKGLAGDVQPWNGGVIFCRGGLFLQYSAVILDELASKDRDKIGPDYADVGEWWGDQMAYGVAAEHFSVYSLPKKFNMDPATENIPPDTVIAHFKGQKRKPWMRKYDYR